MFQEIPGPGILLPRVKTAPAEDPLQPTTDDPRQRLFLATGRGGRGGGNEKGRHPLLAGTRST